jgi:hypothetical protein
MELTRQAVEFRPAGFDAAADAGAAVTDATAAEEVPR